MSLRVNGIVIDARRVADEIDLHLDAADPEAAAQRALVSRELLRQRARDLRLLADTNADGASDDAIVDGLLVAAAVGVLVAMRAPISGAIGGCQSEIGVASAMTAAGLAQLGGGTPEQVIHAAAIALKSLLGLICDPVAGPVEIPCIKRNAVGVSNAFAAADMALAGIASRIPPDEVVDALINVQGLLHPDLRGNLRGGLASTATGRALKDEWYARMKRMQA